MDDSLNVPSLDTDSHHRDPAGANPAGPDSAEAGGWHRTALKVRYQETDKMAVVYHANYLNWFEIGRTEMIRSIGLSYREIEERGIYLPVLEARSRFIVPARYDDRIWIYTRIGAFSPLRLEYEYEIRRCEPEEAWSMDAAPFAENAGRPGTLLTTGATEHVWLSLDWKPVRLNKIAPDLYRRIARLAGEAQNSD
ncbi:thioesterase family protein [Saccharibacillus sp. CPCC 101409]|uniref:acyl-CoA thioesterase n=1 Tax=Saccharibacillus sp. CPCC 101409 TaxID=3058041 RepID=UPI002672D210|nr:thioesterase family protein [Saccharibacillus sp. CPCC 101409]MDO3408852.1 thioesterase family protein [Saccharibacillus sp. CPCC 101409]